MATAVKSLEELVKNFNRAAARVKSDIEADGVSTVTIMAEPGDSPTGEIGFTDHAGGLSELPSVKALLTAAQAWKQAQGELKGLTVIVIHRKGSLENTLIETRELKE